MLKIFNTLTSKKEIFIPIKKNTINLYVCGVTVYDFCHIGHGRTFMVFDVIVRYLRLVGFRVKYIRNITDIDDKIIKKSIEKKINIRVLTNFMIDAMKKDFSLLDILPPDEEPRITDYINDMIIIIQQLIKKKYAYLNKNGDVIFSIDSDPNYGTLSSQSLKYLQSGLRIPINHMKKNPLDFILWKNTNNKEEYSWNSPWGRGRPGWHIECTAINHVFFKDSIDIHGGGSDLLFPHHENEIAQSRCFNNQTKMNFWMHTGIVSVQNQKMSKSLNNVCFLKDILKNYDGEILRYFFISTHYRHPIYYSEKNLQQAHSSLTYLYKALINTTPVFNHEEGIDFELNFYNAMNDDFNTPKVLSIFSQIAKKINFLKNVNVLKTNQLSFRLKKLANHLGLLLKKPEDFLQRKSILTADLENKIKLLIQKRNVARKLKKWIEADKIREQLTSLDVIVEDYYNQTQWRKK